MVAVSDGRQPLPTEPRSVEIADFEDDPRLLAHDRRTRVVVPWRSAVNRSRLRHEA